MNPCNISRTCTSRSWGIDPSISTLRTRKWRSLQLPLIRWVLWVLGLKWSILQSQGSYNCPGSVIWLSASHKSFWTLRRYFVLKISNGQISPKSEVFGGIFNPKFLENYRSDCNPGDRAEKLMTSSMGHYMGTNFSRYRKGSQICVKVQITRKKSETTPHVGSSHAVGGRGLIIVLL